MENAAAIAATPTFDPDQFLNLAERPTPTFAPWNPEPEATEPEATESATTPSQAMPITILADSSDDEIEYSYEVNLTGLLVN